MRARLHDETYKTEVCMLWVGGGLYERHGKAWMASVMGLVHQIHGAANEQTVPTAVSGVPIQWDRPVGVQGGKGGTSRRDAHDGGGWAGHAGRSARPTGAAPRAG